MNNDELKKKIVEITLTELQVQFGCGDTVEVKNREACAESIADALIAAVIENVREAEHRAEVLRLALSKSVLDENAIFDDDVCRYILSNTKLTEEYYIEQAEKELAEERKDD